MLSVLTVARRVPRTSRKSQPAEPILMLGGAPTAHEVLPDEHRLRQLPNLLVLGTKSNRRFEDACKANVY